MRSLKRLYETVDDLYTSKDLEYALDDTPSDGTSYKTFVTLPYAELHAVMGGDPIITSRDSMRPVRVEYILRCQGQTVCVYDWKASVDPIEDPYEPIKWHIAAKEYWPAACVAEAISRGIGPHNQVVAESAQKPNKHIDHIEDRVILDGTKGVDHALRVLGEFYSSLKGKATSKVNTTVKFDGSPSIIAGYDPADGKFFVSTKSVFAKTPVVYKSQAEIPFDTKPGLAAKLSEALKYLPTIGITGIIQGDFMYSKADLKMEVIDGQKYVTFKPNTIVYAVPAESELGKRIANSQVGIVWHTAYTGSSLSGLQAHFGADIVSQLRQTKDVWSEDALYRDVSGQVTFTAEEASEFKSNLASITKLKAKIDIDDLSSDHRSLLTRYINSKVRANQDYLPHDKEIAQFTKWLNAAKDKDVDTKKSDAGKQNAGAKWDRWISEILSKDLAATFEAMRLINHLKLVIMRKLSIASALKTFLQTDNGLKVTGHEGFVAVDHLDGAVKLVDRLEFARSNFSKD